MITELTEYQKDLFPEFVAKWTAIGLSTKAADRPEAERGVNLAYEVAGLKPPKRIIWCDSPMAMMLKKNSIRDSVRASIRASVQDGIWASVRASVRASVGDSVRASIWASVGASVRASVWASVWALVQASVRASVGDSVQACVYGQHEANWLVFYDYMATVLGLVDQTKNLQGLSLVAQHAGWWFPYKDICFVSERHSILNFDVRDRLHCASDMACAYPDGWGIYAWHGHRVPDWVIINPERITPQTILEEDNAELARVMMERYTEERFIQDSDAKPIHSDKFGDLYRIDFKQDEPLAMVNVRCPSTQRRYWLQVPASMQSAHQAVAWTFGYEENWRDYDPIFES